MPPDGAVRDSLVRLVAHSEGGDAEAKDALFAALHAELHRLAQAHLHKSGGNLTLSPTTRKRGGDLTFTTLDEATVAAVQPAWQLEQLARALDELSTMDPPLAELVDSRFFCGLSFAEIAASRGVSERTVYRDWAKARPAPPINAGRVVSAYLPPPRESPWRVARIIRAENLPPVTSATHRHAVLCVALSVPVVLPGPRRLASDMASS